MTKSKVQRNVKNQIPEAKNIEAQNPKFKGMTKCKCSIRLLGQDIKLSFG
jgi:hypothetical protein